jgi:hypothetical protein
VVVAFQAVKSRGLRRLSGDMLAGAPRRRDAWIARCSPTIAPYSGPNSASRPLRVDDFGPDMRHGGLGRGGIRAVTIPKPWGFLRARSWPEWYLWGDFTGSWSPEPRRRASDASAGRREVRHAGT